MSRKVVRLNLPELIRQKEAKENRSKRISQKEIAEAVGVSEPTIRRWVYDEVEDLNKALLGRFLTYFECSVDELLVEETIEDGAQFN